MLSEMHPNDVHLRPAPSFLSLWELLTSTSLLETVLLLPFQSPLWLRNDSMVNPGLP